MRRNGVLVRRQRVAAAAWFSGTDLERIRREGEAAKFALIKPHQHLRKASASISPACSIKRSSSATMSLIGSVIRLRRSASDPPARAEVVVRLLGLLPRDDRDLALDRLALQKGRGERPDVVFRDEVLRPALLHPPLALSRTILSLRAAGLRLFSTTITPAAVVL